MPDLTLIEEHSSLAYGERRRSYKRMQRKMGVVVSHYGSIVHLLSGLACHAMSYLQQLTKLNFSNKFIAFFSICELLGGK